jgi:hypothetical protein
MRFYWLILGVLAVWRFTHLLSYEEGPWDSLERLRQRASGGFWGKLLGCFYCLSLWSALPLALWIGTDWLERVLLWPALSAGAILLERISSREPAVLPASYHYETNETKEEDNVLRTENDAAERRVSAGH